MAASVRVALLLLAAAALLQPGQANRLLRAAPFNCSIVHPACTGCTISRASLLPNLGLSTTTLVCRSCQAPAYLLFEDANSCGERKAVQLIADACCWGPCMQIYAGSKN